MSKQQTDTSEYPDLQVNYIESLLETELVNIQSKFCSDPPDNDISVEKLSPELRLKYLRLLCELRPSQAYATVRRYEMPLDEALEMLERNKVLDAVAYLKKKLGRTKDCLDDFHRVRRSH